MVDVIKRNGSTQEFKPEKIKGSLKEAVKDTGAKVEDKKQMIEKISNEVIQAVKKQDKVKTSKIRGMILGKLSKADKKVLEAWKKYDKKKKSVAK